MSGVDRPKAPPLPRGDRNANPEGISFWALVAEDFRTQDSKILAQGFWVLFWHRFGNWRMSVRSRLLRAPLSLIYNVMYKACEIFCGCKLSYPVPVGRRVRIDHFGGMIFGARSIGSDVILRQNTTLGVLSTDDLNAKPMILDRCDIGAGAVILGHVTIGPDAVVGANAVVLRDVPPHHLAVGVPARIIPRKTRPRADDASGAAEAAE
jgi:serine O-acetyltransferase